MTTIGKFSICSSEFDRKNRDYIYRRDGYHALALHIQDTVDRRFTYLIHGKSVHSMVAALKAHLRPTGLDRELLIEQQWDNLKKGWDGKISLDKWTSQWSQVYHRAHALNMESFREETNPKPILAFLYTVEPLDPVFVNGIHDKILDEDDFERTVTFTGVLTKFLRRAAHLQSSSRNHTSQNQYNALASHAGTSPSNQNVNSNRVPATKDTTSPSSSNSRTYSCPCGAKHRYSQCWYINENQRPADWTPNQHKFQTVQEAATRNTRIRQLMQTNRVTSPSAASTDEDNLEVFGGVALPCNAHISQPMQTTRDTSPSGTDADILEVFGGTALGSNANFHPLQQSCLLDTGASNNIFNALVCFTTYDAYPQPVPLTGVSGRTFIYGAGLARLTITDPITHRTRDILLQNVQYVPDSSANLVSFQQLNRKSGVQWDSEAGFLYHRSSTGDRVPLAIISEHHGEYLLEQYTVPPSQVFSARSCDDQA